MNQTIQNNEVKGTKEISLKSKIYDLVYLQKREAKEQMQVNPAAAVRMHYGKLLQT